MKEIRFPRPAILEQVPVGRHAAIRASAGTGKTFTLEHLVIEILLGTSATIDQILVLTFTEKATTELKVRIRGKIQEILKCEQVTAGFENYWTIDDAARRKLQRAFSELDAAPISTIHGFCQRVLSRSAFDAGRLLVQEMVDGKAAFDRSFIHVLRTKLACEPRYQPYLRHWLEDHDQEVEKLGEMLESAHRFSAVGVPFEPVYRPDEIAAVMREMPDLVATEAATEEIRKQVDKVRGSGRGKLVTDRLGKKLIPVLERFSTTGDVLALMGGISGTGGGYKDFDDSTVIHFIADILDPSEVPPGLTRDWCHFAHRLLPLLVPPLDAIAQHLLEPVAEHLAEEKRAHGQYDFNDMILLVAQAIRGPAGPALIEQLRKDYRYALIDEFQDTDDLQWSLFRQVFLEHEGPNRLFLIGDPKQAIYKFRGADIDTYFEALATLRARTGDEPRALTSNFRSSEPLLSAINRIFDQGVPDPFFTGNNRYEDPLQCGREDLDLQDTTGNRLPPVVIWELGTSGAKTSAGAIRKQLGRGIACEIVRLLDPAIGGVRIVEREGPRAIRPKDIFVLTSTNTEVTQVSRHLREHGVPYFIYKQEGLFQTAEATDILELLRGIDDPGDRSRRLRAWLTPFFGVALDQLEGLLEVNDDHPHLRRLLGWHDLARARRYESLFTRVLEDSDLVTRLILERTGERELTNYLHLFEILLEEAMGTGATLADLIRRLAAYVAGTKKPPGAESTLQRLESEEDAVQVMTMHKSKGLEAGLVFVYGGFGRNRGSSGQASTYRGQGTRLMGITLTGDAKRRHEEEMQAENQRLLYVAVTRARFRVYLPQILLSDDKVLAGSYSRLNRHLTQLTDPGLFAREDIGALTRGAEPVEPARARLEDLPLETAREQRLVNQIEQLRQRHSGFRIASYSSLRGNRLQGRSLERDELQMDPGTGFVEVEDPSGLPGGIAPGLFLHEVLEHIPFRSLLEKPIFEEWAQDPAITALFLEAMSHHGIDAAHLQGSQRLIHRCLTVPIRLGDRGIPALARVEGDRREMEFLFPFPESWHPDLTGTWDGSLEIGRGYVKGIIDYVFSFEGRIYFADWKSDRLPDFGSVALGRHVEAHYGLQLALYTLAIVKMLGIHDAARYEECFGGVLYCFLRGMEASHGVHYLRPSWDEVLRYEMDLAGPA